MSANLLVQPIDEQTLDSFVAELCHDFGCHGFEERESSNYVEERYFIARILGLEVTVALADEINYQDYQFWISLQPEATGLADVSFLDGIADCLARKLALHGHRVARPLSFTRQDQGTVYYRPHPSSEAEPRARVIVEES